MFNQRFLSQNFLVIVVFLQVVLYVSLFLNFQVVREAIGFFYLTFIPGLVCVKLLKLEVDNLELIVYAVGFSIAFLMFAGLALNNLGFIFGLSFPLSTLPLSLLINTLILMGAAAAHLRRGKAQSQIAAPKNWFHFSYLALTLLPLLSIFGGYMVNATGNNLYLLLMTLAIALLFVVEAFSEKSTEVYPFAILMVALALLLQVSFASSHLLPYGGDAPAEFYVFRTTQLAGHWNPVFTFPSDQVMGRYNAMLSITVLPTVYANMLGMNPTFVFKLLYPLIFAFVPVGLYVLWRPFIGKKFAFFSAFLFMSASAFYTEMTALNRQVTGELFFVLLLLLLMSKNMKSDVKFVAFATFSLGLIFSHYALAEIFLFLIFAAWATVVFYLKRPSFNLQFGMILFFFVSMFVWYIYTSGAVVFDSIQTFGTYVLSQLGGFFDPASRGTEVLTGLGLTQSPSFLNTISRGFAYLTELFIVIGVAALIFKKTKFQFERDYTVFGLVAFAFLVALIVVPGLANALNMTRFYHILLMLLAPFCIIGMWSAVNFLFKHEKPILISVLVVAVLVPYFLFQTNLVYEVAGTDSWSVPLSGYRMDPIRLYGYYGYVDDYSFYSAEWTAGNVPYQYNLVADSSLFTVLTAYGLIYRGYITGLLNTTVMKPGEYAYLGYLSNFDQTAYNNTIVHVMNQTDLIYSNGGSEVFYKP